MHGLTIIKCHMRECGILMHISSLPYRYGCGNLGAQARHFADFLNASGVKVWQMLPIHPTGFGNSPYQSLSLFAGNPYFIDPVAHLEQGLLKQSELEETSCGRVDYGMLFNTRIALLKTAYDRAGRPRFEEFVMQKSWPWDYALFMALKARYGFAGLGDWPRDIRAREAAAMSQIIPLIEDNAWFYVFLQKLFFEQWRGFKAYANNRGIKLLGDMSMYAALDSADVWSQPEIFQLDAQLEPSAVAGVPPLSGFAAALSPEQQAHITAYTGSEPCEGLMRAALGSVCRLCILPMQDVLSLGSSARMNTPASAEGNWSWQMDFDAATPELAAKLLKLKLFGRA